MKQFFLTIFLLFLWTGLCPAEEGTSVTSGAALQPMVALFGTNSFVPSLPLQAYQACDTCLGASILGHGCRLHVRPEADQALQRKGVVRLVELTSSQAHELMEELNSVALVQLTITEYRLQSARRQGNRPQKNLPTTLQIAHLGGEIQVWSLGDTEAKCWSFQKVLTDQDPDLSCVPGEFDRNTFGVVALRYALEQAMEGFQK